MDEFELEAKEKFKIDDVIMKIEVPLKKREKETDTIKPYIPEKIRGLIRNRSYSVCCDNMDEILSKKYRKDGKWAWALSVTDKTKCAIICPVPKGNVAEIEKVIAESFPELRVREDSLAEYKDDVNKTITSVTKTIQDNVNPVQITAKVK